MTLQAYIDESCEEEGIFVLAGCISDTESWIAFTKEWERTLEYGTLNKYGRHHFKMSDMALNEERMSRIPLFLQIIEKYVIGFISAKIDISELKRAMSRVRIPDININWDRYSNPYNVTLRCLLDIFHLNREKMSDVISLDEQVDFIFDYRDEKKFIISIWDEYIKARPEKIKQYYGGIPRFENDENCLPIQSADLWAWWVRKWYKEETPNKIKEMDFGEFNVPSTRKHLKIQITLDEDQLVEVMKKTLREQVDENYIICDIEFS